MFLFDQNISHRIISKLPDKFSGSTSIKNEKLINAPDKEIWDFAKKNNFIIVTQDADFNDLNSLYGAPPKIIWIRTGNLKTQQILDTLIKHSEEIDRFILDDNFGCFEITNLKVQ
jgi:predicted nuclease of predicted toxin-antitoxin system